MECIMPGEDINNCKVFFQIGNEVFRPISGDVVALSNKSDTEDISKGESVSFCKDRGFTGTLELTEDGKHQFVLLMKNITCNNWRKMHGMPLIRRKAMKNG